MADPHFWLFADGACGQGDNAIGAWASFVHSPNHRKLLYGVAHPTTISRCELIPIIEGLRWIRKQLPPRAGGVRVRVYSDSEYTIKTLSGGYPPGKNEDLWQAIELVKFGFVPEWIYRQRNSHYYMVLCDSICSLLRKRSIETIQKMLGEGVDVLAVETIVADEPPPEIDATTTTKGLPDANSTHG